MLKYLLRLLVHTYYLLVPRRVRNAINAQSQYFDVLAEANGSNQINGEQVFQGIVVDSLETAPENETEIVLKLVDSFNFAKQRQLSVPLAYKASKQWKLMLEAEWHNYYDSLSSNDLNVIAPFLRNFFRNEGLSGFWGGTKVFEIFRDQKGIAADQRKAMMQRQFSVWRAAFPNTSLSELDAPRIGNPWGYNLSGSVVYEPAFEYHFQSEYFRRLLSEIESPIVLEIGGGFGGLAFHLLKCGGSLKYIGLDLPENTLIQSYYLRSAFPHARILTFGKDFSQLDRATISNYDIILLPNYVLPDIENSVADLVINIRSLSEMRSETIAEYFRQIDRIGRLFFFHENIFLPRRDDFFGIPSSEFPSLDNFTLMAASESRWPRYQKNSSYPCQENIYIHRHAIKTQPTDCKPPLQ